MVRTYSPEVVDEHIEDAKDDDQQRGAPLRLEAHHDHDACKKADDRDNDSANGPRSTENKAHKEEDKQHATGELEVHLAVLLLKLGQAGKDLGLAHPGIGQNHEETTHNGQVAQEEVHVENETVSKGLGDDDTAQTADSIFRVFAGDDEDGANSHSDHIDDEEEMRDTAWD